MKNESLVLRRLLISIMPIIDGGVIIDTGSNDDSKKIVKDIFKEFNKAVEIFDYPFTNFSDTRNFALSKIKGKCDFGFLIDADEELIIKDGFDIKKLKHNLSKHDIGVSEVNYGNRYARRNFFRTSKNFYWTGAVHELLVCDDPTTSYIIEGLETIIHPDGNSWTSQSQKEKYLGHAKLLEEDVSKSNDPRSIFYLAQSYRDAGEHLKSIEWYKNRIERTDGFFEERYFSQYSIGKLYQDIAKFPEAILEWLRCFDLDDTRAEHLPSLIIELQEQKCYQAAYIFSKYGMEKYYKKNPYPNRSLFLIDSAYDQQLLDLHKQNCKILNKIEDLKSFRDNMSIDEFFNSITSAWTGHKEFAKWIVEKMNVNCIVDLGIDYGYSTYCFAMAKKGKVYGIDNFQGDSFTGIRNTHTFVMDSLEYLKGKGINNIEIIKGDFYKIVENWKKKIDILHIDEIPTNIKETYGRWYPFVKDEGVILLHNTQAYSEVKSFLTDVPDMYKYEFKHSGGLGVISKNQDLIQKIKQKYSPELIKKDIPKNDITIAFINHNDKVASKYLISSIEKLNRKVNVISIKSSEGMPADNYNTLLDMATTKYVLFLHEDVTFSSDFLDRIDLAIYTYPDFGALGTVGNYKNNIQWGEQDKIKEVITCDGCCVLVNKDHGLKFDSKIFSEYHLYCDDYFLQCHYKGLKNYTIPINAYEGSLAPLDSENNSFFKHHSTTVSEKGYCWGRYYEFLEKLEYKWENKHTEKIEVDICIVSYAKTDALKKVTERGIETLLSSEQNIKFNVFIMESNNEVCYDHFENIKTFHPTMEFNYNAYLNLLIQEGKSEYICLCNNDLSYQTGWASSIIKAMKNNPLILSASPLCPQTQNRNIFPNNIYEGKRVRIELAGWCIFQQRKIYDSIGKLNEEVVFWYSDNIYSDQLILNDILHVLVTESVVNHHENNLGITGNNVLNEGKRYDFTNGQYENYEKARAKLFASKNVDFYA